jgi:hypothetical protein
MSDLIVYLRKNHIEVVNLKDAKAAAGSASFTSTRLLVGNFPEAESLLSRLVKEVGSSGLFSAKPILVIQPLEMTEGGLSGVEERVFLELGLSAGARHVKVHVGERLSTQAAAALLREK